MPTTHQLPLSQLFVLQRNIDGAYRPERLTYDEAKAIVEAESGFWTIRRLDEVLAETGRA